MARGRIEIGEELGAKKAFAWAIDWPGWCRSGKTAELAHEALIAYAPRYATVVKAAKLEMPSVDGDLLEVVENVEGGGGTDFGVPSVITERDRRPRDGGRGRSAWQRSSRRPGRSSSASSPALRPRCARVRAAADATATRWSGTSIEADHAYAREIGITPAGAALRRARGDRGGARCRPRGPGQAIRRVARSRTASGRRATPRAGSPGTRSTTPGRWRTAPSPAEHRARRVTRTSPSGRRRSPSRPPPSRRPRPRDRPAARSSRTAGVAGGLRELPAIRPPDQRVVGERRAASRGRAADRAGSARPSHGAGRGRGRRGRCPGAGHRRPRRSRTSSCHAGRGSARSPSVPTSSAHGPTSRSIHDSSPAPESRPAGQGRPAPRSRQPPGQPGPGPRAPMRRRPTPRTWSACSRSHRPGPRRGAAPAALAYAAAHPSSVWRSGPASGREPEPAEVLEQRRRRTRAGSAAGRGPRSAAGRRRRPSRASPHVQTALATWPRWR